MMIIPADAKTVPMPWLIRAMTFAFMPVLILLNRKLFVMSRHSAVPITPAKYAKNG